MDKNKQVEELKKALDLEILISSKSAELSRLNNEKFRDAPVMPQRVTITPKYPEIKPKFGDAVKAIEREKLILIIVLCFGLFPIALILFAKEYINGRKNAIENIKNSAEYRAQCANIDNEIAKQQEEADAKYQIALDEYENVLMPQYEKELEAWTEKHNSEINTVRGILKNANEELSKHYEETKILPAQYRTIPALQYIYDMISTSDYDVKQALDLYDRNEQRKLDEARLYEQQKANEQQAIANQIAEEQAALLHEQNVIADKARRQANTAAVVGAVQRHNTNKYLKR